MERCVTAIHQNVEDTFLLEDGIDQACTLYKRDNFEYILIVAGPLPQRTDCT